MKARLAFLVVALTGLTAPSARADEAASPAPRSPTEIVLIGDDAACASVKEVVGELLSREGMAATWASQERFRPQDIFEHQRSTHVAAWIDLSAKDGARLFFRDAGGDRFFIRSLSLARGIDEIAKEEIAHIVSNAVLALSQGGGETLTRSEARQVLHMQAAPETRPEPGEKASTPLRLAIGIMAGAQLFASEVPVVARATLSLALTHGPRWNRIRGSFGGWLDLGYQLPGRYQGNLVGADVDTASARAGVLWEIERALVLRVGLGAGMDRVHYQPRGDSSRVELASASSFYVPALSFWAGVDLRLLDWLALTSRLSLDVPLAQVHFDLQDSNGQTARVLIPYPVLPAVSVGLALVF